MPAACRSLGEHAQMWLYSMIRKWESVHRLLDSKGGTHFAVFPVFLSWSAAWTQLHESSMCIRASVHRVQVWATTQPLNYECHPSGTNLSLRGLGMTTHRSSIALELVITSTLSRGGLIIKLMKINFHSLSLHQPLPSPTREALGLCSQGYRFWNSHFLEMRKKKSQQNQFLTKCEVG